MGHIDRSSSGMFDTWAPSIAVLRECSIHEPHRSPPIAEYTPAIGARSSSIPATITGTDLLGITSGTVSGTAVTVANSVGTSPAFDGFLVTAAPNLNDSSATSSGLSPSVASLYGPQVSLTLNGKDFLPAAQVFAGTAALVTTFSDSSRGVTPYPSNQPG